MPQWQGRSKTNKSGYKIFVFLIKNFGIRAGYFLLIFVAFYFFLFSRKSSRAILHLYRNHLNFSWFKSQVKLYRNYFIFGQTLIDKFVLMAEIPCRLTFEFEGEENLRKIVRDGKGGILLSGHAGNWEAAGQLLKRLETRVNIVMFDGEDEQVKGYLESVSGKKTFKVIYVKDDLSHIYKITEALAANEIICMHADRFLPGNKTLDCNFFGKDAPFPEGPFLLSLKLKVPVAFVYAFKDNNTHYHLYSTDIKRFSQATGDTTHTVLKDYSQSLEKMVKLYPEQWFNYYNFWQK